MKRRRHEARWSDVSYSYMYGFAPYVTVASRRAQAAGRVATLRKQGRAIAPVVIEGRTIATTFWGVAWCDNLERYSDFANRLPRGRSYLRNGSVVDLQIAPGVVTALVSGSDLYDVRVSVGGLPASRWRAACRDVSDAIDSVIELLQGRLSDAVMSRLCADGTGLFPSPREIGFDCSCPDGASMCKHVAAVLYGVGVRLDREPGLLFTLRQVEKEDLVSGAGARAAASLASGRGRTPGSRRIVDESSLSDVFGIDIAAGPSGDGPLVTSSPTPRHAARSRRKAAPKPGARSEVKKPRAPASDATRVKPAPGARKKLAAQKRKAWGRYRALKRD